MALERLRASLAECPIVRFGDYEYFVHPITDGLPLGRPEVLDEVLGELARLGDWSRCDKIVTAESMGFPLAAGLSLRVHRPYVFIRKRQYGLPGEVSLKQTTGYSKTDMYINNVHRGDRVIFVDDVVSTGGTLIAIVKALRVIGAEVVDALIVFEKTREKARMEKELGLKIKTLLKVEVAKGKLVERS
ncbi:MAG TPA: hypoxanthine/guanine phosphoribosyltransferase [Thermoplasmata archaeon]|jgi:adenine phosphoribosyltransferase|nr:hypoxanthine/guanine phosphoribosyltransferase [Thermoplasmata archaeon]